MIATATFAQVAPSDGAAFAGTAGIEFLLHDDAIAGSIISGPIEYEWQYRKRLQSAWEIDGDSH